MPRDANDILREEGADALRQRIDQQQSNGADKRASGLRIWSAGTRPLPPPRGWLLGNSFCRRLVSQLIAGTGVGKSSLRIAQALSLASGRSLTGEHVFVRCRVLIVSLEEDEDELERRVQAAQMHHNIANAEIENWLFLSAPGGTSGKLMQADQKRVVSAGALVAHVEEAIAEYKPDLIIFDPLIKTHALNENDNAQMDMLAQWFSDTASKYDIAIDIPHHISKGVADPGNADRGRGASAVVCAARLVFSLAAMAEDEAEKFSISMNDRRHFVRLDRAKVSGIPSGGPATWFRLVGILLGNGNATYPAGDDIQTVEPWAPPDTWAGLDKVIIGKILDAIAAGPGDGNFYTSAAKSERNAWMVVTHFVPDKSERQARDIIRAWLDNGLLVAFPYKKPGTRKKVKGRKVDDRKRP